MPRRYRLKVTGKADRVMLLWMTRVIEVFRAVPPGWRATVELERQERQEDSEVPRILAGLDSEGMEGSKGVWGFGFRAPFVVPGLF